MQKIAFYYRDMPHVILSFAATDQAMKIAKDGVYKCDGHACPRATIVIESKGKEDKERLKKLQALLEELVDNNQIVAFSMNGVLHEKD